MNTSTSLDSFPIVVAADDSDNFMVFIFIKVTDT